MTRKEIMEMHGIQMLWRESDYQELTEEEAKRAEKLADGLLQIFKENFPERKMS